MNNETVKVFWIILSIQAEIEWMKAENMQREALWQSMAYVERDFAEKAKEIVSVLDSYEF